MKFKDILATYKSAEDLINIGAYTRGSNPKIDRAIQKYDLMVPYLRQGITESVDWRTSMNALKNIPINLVEAKPNFLLTVPALTSNFISKIKDGIKAKGSFIVISFVIPGPKT